MTEAISRADVALYLAKSSGRNRVVADEASIAAAVPTQVKPRPSSPRETRKRKIA